MDETTQSLLRATAIDPEDWDLYLILSDRLEELGDSRCELLRIHVALRRTPPRTPGRQAFYTRLYELMHEESPKWKDNPPAGVQVRFHLGRLIVTANASVLCTPRSRTWLRQQQWWIVELYLSECNDRQLHYLLEENEFPCLRRFECWRSSLSFSAIDAMKKQLPHCEILDLYRYH